MATAARDRKHAGAKASAAGLVCPDCGGRRWLTRMTRAAAGGGIARRRECCQCGRRLLTIEAAATEAAGPQGEALEDGGVVGRLRQFKACLIGLRECAADGIGFAERALEAHNAATGGPTAAALAGSRRQPRSKS